MVKKTEGQVLGHLAGGHGLTAADRDKLMGKIAKEQKKSRARDITSAIEAECAAQFGALTAPGKPGSGLAISDSGAHTRPDKKQGLTPRTCGVMGNRCVDSSARHRAARCSGLTHRRLRSICPRFGRLDGKAQS